MCRTIYFAGWIKIKGEKQKQDALIIDALYQNLTVTIAANATVRLLFFFVGEFDFLNLIMICLMNLIDVNR